MGRPDLLSQGPSSPDGPALPAVEALLSIRDDFARFMLIYQSGIREVTTKIEVLREEFKYTHQYNPIEHVSSRLKSPESIWDKVRRRGLAADLDVIRANINDVAGIRVTCSFRTDVYRVFDLLTGQPDVFVVEVKDYIAHPKPNGYRSLHAILDIPVFLSSGEHLARVELQVRTIAMDFWASLEHKIFYKYRGEVPPEFRASLTAAALTAARLDEEMEQLHHVVQADPHTAD